MSLNSRLLATRNRVVLGGAALLAGMIAAPGAWAQCTNTLPGTIVGGQPITAASFLPLAQGSAVNSLVSVLSTINTAFLTNTTAFVSAPGNPAPNQQGSGAWVRGVTGSVDTDNTGVTRVSALGANLSGSVNCNTTTRTDF